MNEGSMKTCGTIHCSKYLVRTTNLFLYCTNNREVSTTAHPCWARRRSVLPWRYADHDTWRRRWL